MEDKKFALLIDADNTSSKYIKTIVDEITNDVDIAEVWREYWRNMR